MQRAKRSASKPRVSPRKGRELGQEDSHQEKQTVANKNLDTLQINESKTDGIGEAKVKVSDSQINSLDEKRSNRACASASDDADLSSSRSSTSNNEKRKFVSFDIIDAIEVSSADQDVQVQRNGNEPTSTRGRRRGKQYKSKGKSASWTRNENSKFVYRGMAKEDHGKQIYGIEFNWTLKPGQPTTFATVGSNRASIYECSQSTLSQRTPSQVNKPKSLTEPPLKILQVYEDPDLEEIFYTCAWTYNAKGKPLLAVAGYRGIIRILSPPDETCIHHFTGHGGAINYLLVHPKDHNLLLSASQDHSIRLWNIETGYCVAIFGGVEGHRDGVLHVNFDQKGNRFISGGMDHSLKIWHLDREEIETAIRHSYTWKSKIFKDGKVEVFRPFPTIRQNFPDYTTRDIHQNYVDCVHWFGEFILSKASVENKIVCWKGGSTFQKWRDVIDRKTKGATVIYEWEIKDCDAWYIRFGLDFSCKRLALGNELGQTYVYELLHNDPDNIIADTLSHPKCNNCIRQTSWSRDGKVLICVCEDATIWRWDYNGK